MISLVHGGIDFCIARLHCFLSILLCFKRGKRPGRVERVGASEVLLDCPVSLVKVLGLILFFFVSAEVVMPGSHCLGQAEQVASVEVELPSIELLKSASYLVICHG